MKNAAIIKELTEIRASAELVVRRADRMLEGLKTDKKPSKRMFVIQEALDKRKAFLLNKKTGSANHR